MEDRGYETEAEVPFKGIPTKCKSKGIDKGGFKIISANTNYIMYKYYDGKDSPFTDNDRNSLLKDEEKSEFITEPGSDTVYTYYQ